MVKALSARRESEGEEAKLESDLRSRGLERII